MVEQADFAARQADRPTEVAVVGAGLVGTAIALRLVLEGHAVTLVDPEAPGSQCSHGNAGAICPGSCLPVAMPGVLSKIPGWLRDPEGPVAIAPARLPRLLPWLLRFALASRPARVRAISAAMRALHRHAFEAYAPLLDAAGAHNLVFRAGQLFLYESEQARDGDAFGLDLRRNHGIRVELLDRAGLEAIEPVYDPRFRFAVHLPDEGQCADPAELCRGFADAFERLGGRIARTRVTGFARTGANVTGVTTESGRIDAARVVLAAGAWSGRLARLIGRFVPLESQRGYHVQIDDAPIAPRVQAMWAERKFVCSPIRGGVRFAGTVELAGIDAPPTPTRAEALWRLGRRMLPGLDGARHTVWMGHRPCTPDSLPVIGPEPKAPGLLHAYGHGHTGVIGSAVTARLIADLIATRPPTIPLEPYAVTRF